MDFIIISDDKQYLINLGFGKPQYETDMVQLIHDGDEEKIWQEFEIKVFLLDGTDTIHKRIRELPEQLKNFIGEEIVKIAQSTFIANPYFDELMIFYGIDVYTSQEKLKPIICNDCDKKNLYEKREKDNKSDYIKRIKELLKIDMNSEWPFSENLLLQFSVSNLQSVLNNADLDNIAKTIFDGFKEVVYNDDKQIVSFAGDKTCVMGLKALMVAIQRMEPDEKPIIQEFLFSSRLAAWDAEYKLKNSRNKKTRFSNFGSFSLPDKKNSN